MMNKWTAADDPKTIDDEEVVDMDAESKSDEVLDEMEVEEETDPEPEEVVGKTEFNC